MHAVLSEKGLSNSDLGEATDIKSTFRKMHEAVVLWLHSADGILSVQRANCVIAEHGHAAS